MRRHASKLFTLVATFAGALVLSQAASAQRLILNHDEWTLTDYGFLQAPVSTVTYAHNLAAYMNVNGGACNLLVYSNNFGLIGTQLNAALTGAGCSVTYSTGAFDLGTLTNYDGVLLAGVQFNYSASVLTSYVNSGHSVYIANGTANIANEDSIWDSFTHEFGLDFGPNFNGIVGVLPISSGSPLFAGVTELYFNNGNTVSGFGNDPKTQILVSLGNDGLFGIYDGDPPRINPTGVVPEPATVTLLSFGLAALGLRKRRANRA